VTRDAPRTFDALGYGRYLGDFDDSVLASLLTPRREMCDRKFEMVIDALSFIGHPVWLGRKGDESVDLEDRGRARMRSRWSEPSEASSVVDHGSPTSPDAPIPDVQQITVPDPFSPQPSHTSTPRSTSAAPVGRVTTAPPSVHQTPDTSRQPGSATNSRSMSPAVALPFQTTSTESSAGLSSPKMKPRKRAASQGTLESFNLVLVIDTPPDQHLSSHLDVYYR
jgi:Nitrogen Permease regulator of amino acid transport activity 3